VHHCASGSSFLLEPQAMPQENQITTIEEQKSLSARLRSSGAFVLRRSQILRMRWSSESTAWKAHRGRFSHMSRKRRSASAWSMRVFMGHISLVEDPAQMYHKGGKKRDEAAFSLLCKHSIAIVIQGFWQSGEINANRSCDENLPAPIINGFPLSCVPIPVWNGQITVLLLAHLSSLLPSDRNTLRDAPLMSQVFIYNEMIAHVLILFPDGVQFSILRETAFG
jgi:hypothetical protein